MKIVEINMLHNGSTGKIMLGIAQTAALYGHDVWTFSPKYYKRGEKVEYPQIKRHQYFGFVCENMLHLRLSQITGFQGCFSILGTMQLLKKINEIHPDVIHLHNLHNWTINVFMLFHYIKVHRIKTVWTLHDCWAFTGKCPHFTLVKCQKWRDGCFECPQIREYPQTFVDRTNIMWKLKKYCFGNVENMTLVTPSSWLANLTKQSYLKLNHVEVINNGIDLTVFKPTKSDFRHKYNIGSKKFIVLGVSFGWGVKKGLDVFVKLANCLESEMYQVVLVGTNKIVDAELPSNIISIHQTENQKELAEIYTAADVFVNPTREDTFPTVNIEALACGTPVVTFQTGGSPEILDEKCGAIVQSDDKEAMQTEIRRICLQRPYKDVDCVKRAKKFDMSERFFDYVQLYEREQQE